MINYEKGEIKKALTLDQYYEILTDWGGDPEYTSFGLVSSTICHNAPGEGSRKLYLYWNDGSAIFHCYTGCAEPSFDIFQLTIKVFDIQKHIVLDLNEAVRFIAQRFGISASIVDSNELYKSDDWVVLNNYERIQKTELKDYHIQLQEYDNTILSRLNYNIIIRPWLNDNISQEIINKNYIGFYPGGNQITIPHYDVDNRFIGLRGRTVCKEDAELYGKYRPIKINGQLYNHPLGFNLYGLNIAKSNISLIKKAIIFESEKSVLQYQSYFGFENSIAVACCGSNISNYQIQMLLDCGVEEIIVAFDRQFQECGDNEFKKLTNHLIKIHEKLKNYVSISFIFDKHMITDYKDAPTDKGKDIFLELFKERIFL